MAKQTSMKPCISCKGTGLINNGEIKCTWCGGDGQSLERDFSIQTSELTIEDYKASFKDHQRLVREIDVIINGEGGAARQASLCDLVGQIKSIKREWDIWVPCVYSESGSTT